MGENKFKTELVEFLKKTAAHFKGKADFVNNPAGGMFVSHWGGTLVDFTDTVLYPQLEIDSSDRVTFCIKIKVKDPEEYRILRKFWSGRVIEIFESFDIKLEKPNKFGVGQHMTVAVLPFQNKEKDIKVGMGEMERVTAILSTCVVPALVKQ